MVVVCVCGGGGGGTPIFSYICRFGPFLGFKILNFNIYFYYFFFFFFFFGGGVRKMKIWGYEKNVDIVLGSLQNWTIWGGSFLHILGIF